MNKHFLVCPYEDSLWSRLKGKSVVIRIKEYGQIEDVIEYSKKYNFHLHCLWIQVHIPFSHFRVNDAWKDIPIALYVPELGEFALFMRNLALLRQMNIRVYFPSSKEANFSSIRILSSLGLETAILFDQSIVNWEKLNDLMTYALLNLTAHAPIAPFNYIASRYQPNQRNPWGAVYFDDASTYLHVDSSGRIALSEKDLSAGNFVLDRLDNIDTFVQSDKYADYLDDWRNEFLEEEGCAYCPAWRVCVGRFSNGMKSDQGCRTVFTDLLDTLEQYQSVDRYKNKHVEIWRP